MVCARALEAIRDTLGRQDKRGSQVDQLIHEQDIIGTQRSIEEQVQDLHLPLLLLPLLLLLLLLLLLPHTLTQGSICSGDFRTGRRAATGGGRGGSTSVRRGREQDQLQPGPVEDGFA